MGHFLINDGNTRAQAPDHVITVVVLVNHFFRDDQRHPKFGLFGSETHDDADIGQEREIEAGRHHADYRHGCAAELNAFADHGRVTSKPARPQFMAENDDLFVPGSRVFREETTAQKRCDSEDTKEVWGDSSAKQKLSAIPAGENQVHGVDCGGVIKQTGFLPALELVNRADLRTISHEGYCFGDGHQTVRMLEWQRPHDYGV